MANVKNYYVLKNIFRLFLLIKPSKRKKIYLILFFMLANGFAEMITLASFLPFIMIISNPGEFKNLRYFSDLINLFGFDNNINISLIISFIIGFAITISGCLRLLNVWINGRYSANVGTDLSSELFQQILYKPYEVHINENSSESINILTLHINNVVGLINNVLQVVSSIIVSIFILITLALINFKVFLFSFLVVFFIYISIYKKVVKRLIMNSYLVSENSKRLLQILQESIGSIKDIIISNNQSRFLDNYKKLDYKTRKKIALSNFLSCFPRSVIETLVLLCLIIFSASFILNSNDNSDELILIIGSLAVAAQRLLPLFQQIYTGWASVNNNLSSIEKVINLLKQNKITKTKIKFNKLNFKNKIILQNISFRYRDAKRNTLSNINLEIKKGESIGIVGRTGSGKTTLIDLIMGLLIPTSGNFFIDNINLIEKNNLSLINTWQNQIAYVPQKIYLADDTFEKNIAFTEINNVIDLKKVKEVANKSIINEFILDSPNGYKTKIGERGMKLSGGEMQRIGIARALYKSHQILILDEATSALDNTTEDLLMDSLYKSNDDITLIIVAHRLRTLKKCDRIIELNKGKIKWTGTSIEFFKKL